MLTLLLDNLQQSTIDISPEYIKFIISHALMYCYENNIAFPKNDV